MLSQGVIKMYKFLLLLMCSCGVVSMAGEGWLVHLTPKHQKEAFIVRM